MSKPTDIAKQIEKYLNGELDARAMHQLEREAQNDPFLMDALEGYGKAGGNQQANLNDITGRLQQRTAKGKVRSMLMWRLTAAASIIVVLGAVGLWFYNDKPKLNENELAKQVEVVKPSGVVGGSADENIGSDTTLQKAIEQPAPAKAPYVASAKSKRYSPRKKKQPSELLLDEPVAANDVVADKQSDALQEKVAVGFFNTKKEQTYANKATDTVKKTSDFLVGRISGLNVVNATPDKKNKIMIGKVTDEANLPLPGVAVKVNGTNTGTLTDSQGNFKIPVVPDKSELDIAFVGYNSTRVKVKDQDSLMIAMVPNQNALYEVVVTGYGGRGKIIKGAHPANGWDEFNQYLKENAISPDGKEGTVKLSFIVDEDGSLTDFEITKSLSDETDQQAIALIKDGPKWVPDVNDKPKKIKLSIKFKAE